MNLDQELALANTVVTSLATGTAVYWTYWLTTRKEKRERIERRERAYAAERNLLINLRAMISAGKSNDGSPHYYRDLLARVKGVCEYGELATKEVFEYTDIKLISQFMELKRISYHYRDGMAEIIIQHQDTDTGKVQIRNLADHIEHRTKNYFIHYGINPHVAYAEPREPKQKKLARPKPHGLAAADLEL